MLLLRLVTYLVEYLSYKRKVIGSIPILTPIYDMRNPPFLLFNKKVVVMYS